jgi:hypothetical protein
MLYRLFSPFLEFIKTNYTKLIIALVLAVIAYLVYIGTTSSLKKLKTAIFSSYPFDLFFPHEGSWSVGYFLIMLVFLSLLIFFFSKGGFYGGPA